MAWQINSTAAPAAIYNRVEAGVGYSVPTDDVPLTLAAWFKTKSTQTAALPLVTLGGFSNNSRYALQYNGYLTNKTITAYVYNGTTEFDSVSTNECSVSTWHHAAGVFASSSSRTSYLDGVASTTNTNTLALTTTDINAVTCFNVRQTNAWAYTAASLDGFAMADVAIWNVALTSDEIVALAKGFSPLRIRPGSLKLYNSMCRDQSNFSFGTQTGNYAFNRIIDKNASLIRSDTGDTSTKWDVVPGPTKHIGGL